jgi:pentatricopeptide repeat protein
MKNLKYGLILILPAVCWIFLYSCSTTGSGKLRDISNEDKEFFDIINEAQTESADTDTTGRKSKAKEHVISASTLNQQAKYAEAILEYQQALRYDSSAAILSLIADNYLQLSKYDIAKEYILSALKINPDLESALELLGGLYIFERKYTEAQSVFEHIYKLDKSLGNRIKLANVYEYGNNPEKAIAIYEEMLSEGEEPNILLRLSGLYKKNKMDDKYEQTIEKLFKYSSVKDRYAEILIEEYSAKKKYDKIKNLLDKIEKELSVEEVEDIFGIVGLYYNLDSAEQVKDYIPDLIKRLDNRFYLSSDINRMGGYLSGKIRDSLKSKEFFERYLKLTDSLADGPLEVGSYYIGLHWYSMCIELLKGYYPRFPNDNRFALYLSYAYDETGNTGRSIEILQIALQRDSMSFDLMTQLGIMYDKAGNKDSSNLIYDLALKLNPDDPLVNNNFAYSLSEQGKNLDKALAMIEVALKKEPEMPSYLDTYAWIHYQLGNYDKALNFINKAIENGGKSAEIFDHLGDINMKLGDSQKAVEAWKKAFDIEPGNGKILDKLKNIK